MSNSSSRESSTERFASVRPLAASVTGGVIAGLIAFVVASPSAPQATPPIPPFPAAATDPVESSTRRDVMRASFFDAEVEPRIIETDRLNREAAHRCVESLGQVIDRYRDGVDPFVKDLTSISTRLGIVRRMPGNWWKDDNRIEAYVQEKFEKHLFSRQTLTRDVAGVLDDFRSEIDANQKRMLVSIQASLETADLPEVDIEDYEPFFASVANQLQTYSAEQGTTSVYNGLTVLAVSEVGSFAAVSVVSGLLARFGSAAAATAAVGVGATAGSTAVGASGGSLAGPVGTVVGLGVGLAVGLSIDWWMTERFEEKMNQQMKGYLDSLEQTLLHGSSGSIQNVSLVHRSAGSGIAEGLPVVCDRLLIAYRERFYEQIVTQASP